MHFTLYVGEYSVENVCTKNEKLAPQKAKIAAKVFNCANNTLNINGFLGTRQNLLFSTAEFFASDIQRSLRC